MSKVYDTCYLIGFEISIFSISFIENNICIIIPSIAKRQLSTITEGLKTKYLLYVVLVTNTNVVNNIYFSTFI